MAASSSFSMPDGAATPVSHTFSPDRTGPGEARWTDRSISTEIGQPQVHLAQTEPSKSGGVRRVTVRISVPVLEVSAPSTDTGYQPAPKVAYTMTAVVQYLIPQRANAVDKATLRQFVASTVDKQFVTDAVVNREMPW